MFAGWSRPRSEERELRSFFGGGGTPLGEASIEVSAVRGACPENDILFGQRRAKAKWRVACVADGAPPCIVFIQYWVPLRRLPRIILVRRI